MPKCYFLENHACITVDGRYRPCCVFTTDDLLPSVNDYSINEYKQTDEFVNLKKIMDTKKWHPGCIKCKNDEKNNIKSHRLQSKDYGNNGITYLELSLSNKCNLTCKFCGPTASSKWADLIDNNLELKDLFYKKKSVKNLPFKKIFKDIDLSKLRKLKYLGGEPFITPEIKELCNYLEEEGVIGNIELLVATNCTFFPKKWIEQISKFKKITIGLSIDGFGKSNEYSRTGSDWHTVETVSKQWKSISTKNKQFHVYIASTISALTVHNYSDLVKWAKLNNIRLETNICYTPNHLSFSALPDNYKYSILDNYNKNLLKNTKFNNDDFSKFKEYIKKTDAVQNIKIDDYIPKLAEYLD